MRDYQLDGRSPTHAVQVQQVAEALEVLRHAHARGEAVVPWGGGTHQDWGDRLTRYDVALDLTLLKGVLAFRPEELTLTAQVGVTLAEVNELVGKHGQCLPLDTEEPERATLGGAIATGAAGPWRMRYGTARDAILWCETLSSDGRRIEGGAQVVKNVAGYDLPRLYTGSLGALGVLSAVCVRLQPKPASVRLIAIGLLEADNARTIAQTLVTGDLEPAVLSLVKGDPAWDEPFGVGPWVLLVGFAGVQEATQWQVEQVLALARHIPHVAIDHYEQDDARLVIQQTMQARRRGDGVLKVMVRPGDVSVLADWITQMATTRPVGVLADVGAGVVRTVWRANRLESVRAGIDEVKQMTRDLGGNWVLERAPGDWKSGLGSVWGEPKPAQGLMRQIKQQFDPRLVLNPGRTAGG